MDYPFKSRTAALSAIAYQRKEPFVLGNIAPDSGIPNEDGTGFVPDAAISHFRSLDQNGIKCIHETDFIQQYFTPAQRQTYSDSEYAFFLGYLAHLLTDKIWARDIVYAAKEKIPCTLCVRPQPVLADHQTRLV